jgi:hypothetical protein
MYEVFKVLLDVALVTNYTIEVHTRIRFGAFMSMLGEHPDHWSTSRKVRRVGTLDQNVITLCPGEDFDIRKEYLEPNEAAQALSRCCPLATGFLGVAMNAPLLSKENEDFKAGVVVCVIKLNLQEVPKAARSSNNAKLCTTVGRQKYYEPKEILDLVDQVSCT